VVFDPVKFGFDFSVEEYNYYKQRSEEHYANFGTDVDLDELIAAYRAPKRSPKPHKTGVETIHPQTPQTRSVWLDKKGHSGLKSTLSHHLYRRRVLFFRAPVK
jgi:hypothetical protein